MSRTKRRQPERPSLHKRLTRLTFTVTLIVTLIYTMSGLVVPISIEKISLLTALLSLLNILVSNQNEGDR